MGWLRAPREVWLAVALAPVLLLLYLAPGDPELDGTTRAVAMLLLWAVLLARGSKIAWVFGAGYTGAVAVIFIYQLFDPSSEPGATLVHYALIAATVAQFTLLLNTRVMDWVGVGRDRGAARPPTAATG